MPRAKRPTITRPAEATGARVPQGLVPPGVPPDDLQASIQKARSSNERLRSTAPPGKHWVAVEIDSPIAEYESPIDDYLDQISPVSNPGEPMYRLIGNNRKVHSSKRILILECTEEDYQFVQDQIVKETVSTLSIIQRPVSLPGGVKILDEFSMQRPKMPAELAG